MFPVWDLFPRSPDLGPWGLGPKVPPGGLGYQSGTLSGHDHSVPESLREERERLR